MSSYGFLKIKILRSLISVFLLILLGPLLCSATAQVVVRGKLQRVGPNGALYPAPYMAVTLSNKVFRSPIAYSGSDGMYYLHNIPPGSYQLQISVSNKTLNYAIQVTQRQYFDVAPIRLPY